MKITTILPVSRTSYLDKVLESLVNQTYKPDNIIVVFDGNDNEFLAVRNKIIELKNIDKVVMVSNSLAVAHTIPDRRRHIVNIHNQIREIMTDCDWVFSIEDDGILPSDALEKLVTNMNTLQLKKGDVGMITGVELGRWGVPYVGAWKVDDIFETKKVESLENKAPEGGVEEVDGCGLYCALIRADYYKRHEFFTSNGLGPDVNLGIFLRQQGLRNYIDWSIHVTHLTFREGRDIEIHATEKARVVKFHLLSGNTWGH